MAPIRSIRTPCLLRIALPIRPYLLRIPLRVTLRIPPYRLLRLSLARIRTRRLLRRLIRVTLRTLRTPLYRFLRLSLRRYPNWIRRVCLNHWTFLWLPIARLRGLLGRRPDVRRHRWRLPGATLLVVGSLPKHLSFALHHWALQGGLRITLLPLRSVSTDCLHHTVPLRTSLCIGTIRRIR